MNTPTLEPAAAVQPVTVAASHEPATPSPVVHLQNILVPTDFSEHSLKAIRYAVPFATIFGAKLTLLHVVEPPVYTPEIAYLPSPGPKVLGELEKRLQDIRDARVPWDLPTNVLVRNEFASDGIFNTARETKADLIIITTHGYTGIKHLLLGSTAERIVREAPCPVLVVREGEREFV